MYCSLWPVLSQPHPHSIPFNATMSTNPSPELNSLFETALNDFERRAGTNLARHRIIDKLANCQSADSVLDVLQEQAQALRNFRGDDGKLMTWLKRTVNVLYTLSTSGVLGEGIGLVCANSFDWLHRIIYSFFSPFHQQKQSSLDSEYSLAYVTYLSSIESGILTPVAFIRQSKISARATMDLSIFSNLSNPSSGASTFIRRSHPPRRYPRSS
jgi:hypothetical protein